VEDSGAGGCDGGIGGLARFDRPSVAPPAAQLEAAERRRPWPWRRRRSRLRRRRPRRPRRAGLLRRLRRRRRRRRPSPPPAAAARRPASAQPSTMAATSATGTSLAKSPRTSRRSPGSLSRKAASTSATSPAPTASSIRRSTFVRAATQAPSSSAVGCARRWPWRSLARSGAQLSMARKNSRSWPASARHTSRRVVPGRATRCT
jgi:hypothetical protein